MKNYWAKIAILSATLIWGTSFVIMKDTLDSIPTLYLLAIRFSIAALLLFIVSIPKLKKIDLGHITGGALMGLFLFLAYVFQTYGLVYTTPGKNAFLTTSYCIIVPFLYWILVRKRPDKYNIIAAFTGLIGIGLLSLDSGLSINAGDALTLACGFFYACHILATAGVSSGRDMFLLITVQFFTAAILASIGAMLFEELPTHFSVATTVNILYLSVVATTIALFLQAIGQKYTDPNSASLILTFESVFGAGFSIILGYDDLTIRSALGFIIMFIAVIISEVKPGKKRKQI